MSKSRKSKILATMMCAAVMAGLHAAPVMAADTGLTVSDSKVVAGKSVTINGVTLAGNKVTATSLQLGETVLSEPNLKNVNSIFSSSAGTSAKPAIYVGGIYVKDNNGKTNFSVSNAGAVTANNGITSNKTTVTTTGAGANDDFDGTSNFNSAKDKLESALISNTKYVSNSELGFSGDKYSKIDGIDIDDFNKYGVTVGINSNYDDKLKELAGTKATSTGKVISDQNGLSVTSSQSSESLTVTETFEKESVVAEYQNTQENGATKGNVSINKNGGTTTYKVTHTTTDITNNFSNTSTGGLSFNKTSSQKKEEFVQTAEINENGTGNLLDGTTSYTQTDTTNSMSQNNGAFSMSGTIQNNTFADENDFTEGKFDSGTKTSNSIAGSNGSISMTASKDYIDYTDGIAEGSVGYNQAANKTTVSSIKVNSASGTDAEDASGSITLSNSKVNYEYGNDYDDFGKPSSTTYTYEYNTTATVGKGDFTVSGTRYDDAGKASSAGSMYVNSESYGTRLSQTNYKEDGTSQSATISLNNGIVAISGSESASLKAGNYGFATAKDGTNTITGKNFAVTANGTLTLNNGANNTLYVDASGNLTNTASNGTSTSKVTNNYNGLTTTVTENDGDKAVSSSTTLNYGIKDSYTDANGTHSVTTNGNGTTFSATGMGSTVINGGTIKTGSTTINGTGMTVGSTSISSGNIKVGNTQITGNSITTDTLNVNTIKLGSQIVDNDGNRLVGIEISANGNLTSSVVNGDYSSKLTNQYNGLTSTVAYKDADNNEYTSTFTNKYNGTTTTVKGKGNTVTSKTTADSIEDIFVNADGTHRVTTNGLGTSFYASGIGTTTINGNKITTKYINDVDFSKWYKDVNANLDELNDKTQNINTNNTYGKGEQPAGGSSTIWWQYRLYRQLGSR